MQRPYIPDVSVIRQTVLIRPPATWEERIFDTTRRSYIPIEAERLVHHKVLNNPVICVGEIHNDVVHHMAELEIVKVRRRPYSASNTFHHRVDFAFCAARTNPVLSHSGWWLQAVHRKRGRNMALGMEMFYRQHQSLLDDYVFGSGTLSSLKADTNWDKTWGHKLSHYAKILQYAKTHQIRVVGLNVPVPVVQVSATPTSTALYTMATKLLMAGAESGLGGNCRWCASLGWRTCPTSSVPCCPRWTSPTRVTATGTLTFNRHAQHEPGLITHRSTHADHVV